MNGSPLTLYLLRHHRVCGPKGIFYSQMDIPLSPQGHRASLRDGARVAALVRREGRPLAAVFSSDLSRSLVLARAVSRCSNAPLFTTPALREVDFGAWTGLTWREIEERWPGGLARRFRDLAGTAPPQGESMGDVAARVKGVLDRLREEFMGRAVAVVAHGGTNRVILALLLSMELQRIFSLEQGFGCLNIVDLHPDGVAVARLINGRPW